MAITRTIGKNTLGDNNKMHVRLREYDMSSQNLSYVFRSTMGVGMLVPFMKIVCQKGDIFDIKLTNKTMTHPTLGPLFGSFKLQHFIFTAGFRLYNSWLHNNRTGIGMKMSDIKFPTIYRGDGLEANNEIKHNPSSLYAYLGWKGSKQAIKGTGAMKQAVPWLIYLDIFKNYFANTQEENFYIMTGGSEAQVTFQQQDESTFTAQVGKDVNHAWTGPMASNATLKAEDNVKNYSEFWKSIKIRFYNPSTGQKKESYVNYLTSNSNTQTIITDKITTVFPAGNSLNGYTTIQGIYIGNFPGDKTRYENSLKTILKEEKLETLDKIRDEILKNPGNNILQLHATTDNDVNNLFADIRKASKNKLGGLVLKTYDSDIFNNWVKTEWIDGENGISKVTALKPDEDGTITMDALNLQQKVYNMLNRIAVSGGTYRDWLETVYTAGRYLDRPETPVFQGGMSQMIEFDEVVATTGNTEGQVLGELAGRGYARQPNTSGRLHFQVEEPGYVMGLVAITPMVDYSQGNDFDLNLFTMDDLHKPALDGIGYQDLMNEQRAWWTAEQNGTAIKDTTPGKSVAWIDYMTNFNKTFGNFATGENEDFMVLNRNYERDDNNGISNGSTYINPQEHIDIFADTALDSQNFWVQTACEITRRGNYSAKQIPNL
nr:MAG TPA: Major capsid protein [Microviridae sp.]